MNAYEAAIAVLESGPRTQVRVKDAAEQALNAHDLFAVYVEFSTRALTWVGQAHSKGGEPEKLVLASKAIALLSDHEVADTIAHEVAHLLVPTKRGHGREWQVACGRTGANAEANASHEASEVVRRLFRWAVACTACDNVMPVPGKRSGEYFCRKCGADCALVDLRSPTLRGEPAAIRAVEAVHHEFLAADTALKRFKRA